MAPRSSAIGDEGGPLWLHDPAARSIQVAGGKAARLAQLITAGFGVPDGLVIPIAAERTDPIAHDTSRSLAATIVEHMGRGPFAVRSSAAGEDGTNRSWAGMFRTVLNVTGVERIADALRTVSASGLEARAQGYGAGDPGRLAVLVQPMIHARLAGVAFTSDQSEGQRSVIVTVVDGLADGLVAGAVTGDQWRVTSGVVTGPVEAHTSATADDIATVAGLAISVADHLGVEQDIEWAVDTKQLWLLQARPLTAPVPVADDLRRLPDEHTLVGIAASPGRATGPVRIVRDSGDLSRVQLGDVLVAPTTSPAWTAVFADIAAVVTDIGSAAAHAAIVAREFAIPAVTDTGDASTRLRDGLVVTVDGDRGIVQFD